jgi:hypothetical protein
MRAMPLARMIDKSEGEPTDRLGRIAAAMLKAGEDHVESRVDDKAIIMLDDSDDHGMVAHGGYTEDESAAAFVNMLAHLTMLAQANGMQLDVIPMAEPPGQG